MVAQVRRFNSTVTQRIGYLSRLQRAFQDDGLIAIEPSPADGRVRTARLTQAGRRELAALDRRSDDAAAAIFQPLNTGQRDQPVTAMARVGRLIRRAVRGCRRR